MVISQNIPTSLNTSPNSMISGTCMHISVHICGTEGGREREGGRWVGGYDGFDIVLAWSVYVLWECIPAHVWGCLPCSVSQ